MHYVNASATVFVNFLIKNSQEKYCNYLIASSYFVKENACFTSRKKDIYSDHVRLGRRLSFGKRVIILSLSGKIVYATPDNARPVNIIIVIVIIIIMSNNDDNK